MVITTEDLRRLGITNMTVSVEEMAVIERTDLSEQFKKVHADRRISPEDRQRIIELGVKAIGRRT